MGKTYTCIKELSFDIPDEVIKPGTKFTVIRQDKNRCFIQSNEQVYEIYDWALKEYFKEVT